MPPAPPSPASPSPWSCAAACARRPSPLVAADVEDWRSAPRSRPGCSPASCSPPPSPAAAMPAPPRLRRPGDGRARRAACRSRCRSAWPSAASRALLNRAAAAPVVAGMEALGPRRARRPAGRPPLGPRNPARPHRLRRRPRPGAARHRRSTSRPPTGCAARSSPRIAGRHAPGRRRRRLHRRRGLRRPHHRLHRLTRLRRCPRGRPRRAARVTMSAAGIRGIDEDVAFDRAGR